MEGGRDTGRGRSKLPGREPDWDSILGPQDHAPRPKAGAKPLSPPGIPTTVLYLCSFTNLILERNGIKPL